MDAETERVRLQEEGETERLRISDYTECLYTLSRVECDRAYYPDRKEPPTPLDADQQAKLEATRGARARELYEFCVTKKDAAHCEDVVVRILGSIEVAP